MVRDYPCPACWDGTTYLNCESCAGTGEAVTVDGHCPDCDGQGETEGPACTLCCATGRVPMHLAHLWEAAMSHRGDDDSTTQGSLAKYYRHRHQMIQKCKSIHGYWDCSLDGAEAFCGVSLRDLDDGLDLDLQGLAWGYAGEGPNGLADILADLGICGGNRDCALALVSGLEIKSGWSITRRTEEQP